MQLKLKLFLIIICLIFDCFIYNKIKTSKIQLKYSLVWIFLTFILIVLSVFDSLLDPIKNFLGFETVSNMIFLIGFFLLALITFSLSTKLSEQNMKITKLTQELAILKKEINKK